MIEWRAIFDRHGFDYVEGPAPDVRSGHIGFPCPRCGAADAGTHYAIDVTSGKVRGCWRDPSHWLRPVDLLVELLGVSVSQAIELAGGKGERSELSTILERLEGPSASAPREFEVFDMPPHFVPFSAKVCRVGNPFVDYLIHRGFPDPQELSWRFDIRWCHVGRFAPRIIFPIYRAASDGEDDLLGWTGRAITKSAKARYIAHPTGDAMEHLLWESATTRPGDVLIVVEGPFDALKVAAAADFPATVVALMTNHAGPAKLARIIKLGLIAKTTLVILDAGAEGQALNLWRDLAVIQPQLAFVPREFKDPGEMSFKEVREFLASHVG